MKFTIYTLFLFFFMNTYNTVFSQTNYAPNEILIKFKPNRTASQKVNLKTRLNAVTKKEFSNIGVALWEVCEEENCIEELIQEYKNHPDVDFVEPNYYVSGTHFNPTDKPKLPTSNAPSKADQTPIDPDFYQQWSLQNTGQEDGVPGADIDAIKAWDITTSAQSIVVAVIDSGVDWTHPDLVNNIWQNLAEDADGDNRVLELIDGEWVFDPGDENGIDDDGNGYIDDFIGWNFVDGNNDPFDNTNFGHGTHVAGILGANGNNEIGMAGVCWDAQIAALKFLDLNNNGKFSDAVAALNYAVSMNIPISNNSWGGTGYCEMMNLAIQNAAASNHLFVASAGNDALDLDSINYYPASYTSENKIVVAATNRNDSIWPSSNIGQNIVDLAAPGDAIYSTIPNNEYTAYPGTSQAAPHVAGACALLWGIYPDRPPAEIKEAIVNSADQLPVLQNTTISGGRLNLFEALNYFGEIIADDFSGQSRKEDSLSLIALYNTTGGPFWSTSWDLGESMENWYGIGFSGSGRINSLNLSSNNLAGWLPESIADIEKLDDVHLDNNKLSGHIPQAFEDLYGLYLQNNQYSFSDLGNIYDTAVSDFYYASQQNMHTYRFENTLYIKTGGLPNNTYTWFKDNAPYGNSVVADSALIITEAGNYFCEISNSLITQSNNSAKNLVLQSTPIYIDPTLSCRERDSLVLVDLYNMVSGGNWNNTWNLNSPMNNWFGVSLNASGCVVVLSLPANNLAGNIPESIGNLSNLSTLDLSQNISLAGNIPQSIGNLNNLTTIDLSNNNITGNIPKSISNLSNLINLNLSFNNFIGNMPSDIGKLNNLSQLNLNDNNLIGGIPRSITNLNNLMVLDLRNNRLTFYSMPTFSTMNINDFRYAPQDSISTYKTEKSLYVAAGGSISNNNYTWYRGNTPQRTIKRDSTYRPTASGWYHCRAANDIYTNESDPEQDLILKSRAIYFEYPVYPGDFNNNGIVNNDDLLYFGLALDSTGIARTDATTDWTPQACPEWPSNIQGINGKHQDGNGDGIVNYSDIPIISLNYDKTHSFALPVTGNSNYKFELRPLSSNIVRTERYALHFEESTAPSSMHGVAGSVSLSNLPAVDAQIDISNSCINPDAFIGYFHPDEKRLDFALTRTDLMNVPCNGALAIVEVMLDDTINPGQSMRLDTNNGTVISATGEQESIKGSSTYDTYTEVTPDASVLFFHLTSTDEQCSSWGEASVIIEGGIPPFTYLWSTGETTAAIYNLNAGEYSVTVMDAAGIPQSKQVSIAGHFLPILNEDGELEYCSPPSCPSTIVLMNTVPAGLHQAHAQVRSGGVITTGSNVHYRAGVSVLLEAGFEVKGGAGFEVRIEGCGQ